MKKKVVSLLLCTALVLGSTFTASATEPKQITSSNIKSSEAVKATKDAYDAEVKADEAQSAAATAKQELANTSEDASEYNTLKGKAGIQSSEVSSEISEVSSEIGGESSEVNDYVGAIQSIYDSADASVDTLVNGDNENDSLAKKIADKDTEIKYTDNLSKVASVDLADSATAKQTAVDAKDEILKKIENHSGSTYTKEEKEELVGKADEA